ncbi:ATP-binding protein [Actinomadura craniellae]|uniref:ATP-binding protein n=1 Tax=Actinomadura craniellae TaxID=2231787 RepID=UPI001F32A18A|nr:ATP-binding protein [Actinomadura craniellae]
MLQDVSAVMRWRRTFPGVEVQARCARDFAKVLLDGRPVLGDVLVVVTELVANAIRHTASGGPGGAVGVELRCCRRGVAVAVTDQGGPGEPVARTVGETLDALAEGGRGLLTVAAYATWWRWCGGVSGRTVTAFFAE